MRIFIVLGKKKTTWIWKPWLALQELNCTLCVPLQTSWSVETGL